MHDFTRSLIQHEGEFNLVVCGLIAGILMFLAVIMFRAALMDFRPRWKSHHPYRWPKLISAVYFAGGTATYLAYLVSHGDSATLDAFFIYVWLVFFLGMGLHTKLMSRELKAGGQDVPKGSDLFPWERWMKRIPRRKT